MKGKLTTSLKENKPLTDTQNRGKLTMKKKQEERT